MNKRHLVIVLVLATAVQLAMVVAGHYVAFIKDNVFALGGMAISLLAGLVYAKFVDTGWKQSVTGAALVGGVSALLGIAVSLALKDVPVMVLALGTVSSTVTGAIGGALALPLRKSKPVSS